MQIEATTQGAAETGADTIAVGVFDGEDIAHDVEGGLLQKLLDRGEARRAFRRLAVVHHDDRRYLIVGLGDRARFDTERARVAAATVHGRARELSTGTLCWEVPHHLDDAHVGALVEGTLLAAYRFDRYRNHPEDDGGIERLVVSAHHPVDGPVNWAAALATAQNRARDLQNAPANELTPSDLAHRAHELVAEVGGDHLTLEVRGEEEIAALGMGAFAAVARGSHEEARLIELRYAGPDATGPLLAFVGKAVTFDTGGISIKPALRMAEMKFDMSGGAVVLEAIGAIARLRLPVRVLGVIGATENMPSGHATRPGDIVRAANGTTIEINNTDAEGRLVLADCLVHAVNHGAERIVDLATLTGAIVTALGGAHAGLFANDDEWAGRVQEAASASDDLVWRLPLHADYADAIKGRYGDIVNSTENRQAASITAAEFLKRFVSDVPWAHLDIAGTANDTGRPYAPYGGTGYGVRLLVELAKRSAS
ncbi:leucyl aminopeptidase [Conexibacter sp. JD483]|uniref:leucyl aminopeptidase family protein n=1 Tax=unclassified Conexibacter TaxID=2627773 RepID=UPI002722BE25|nr:MULTISPECIES: leucyl aminopeptidase [unclassified Conexibacter]MDO8186742.1 leucyl aminopeptidase [Conexibacter sp. CPCC 205706]MDO8199028.1 leucyl aminopeptidase [Conexibacter sp. CPCC 205762]MDR9368480.1 leucyl aminopeptidase [Conexibacter sp. JD483]